MALALAVGAPLAWLLAKSLHNLSRRWAVFVPVGMVLHDPITLLDPVLFQRSTVARVGPAAAGTERGLAPSTSASEPPAWPWRWP